MKKKTGFLIAALMVCAVLATFMFAGCETKKDEEFASLTFTVGEKSDAGYAISLTTDTGATAETTANKEFVGQVLRQLKEEGKLTMVADEGDYGLYIKSMGEMIPDAAKNEFISFYSSSTDINHAGSLIPVEKGGVKYYQTNKGVDSMPLITGVTYLFKIDTFTL